VSTWRPISPPAFWKRWLPEWLHDPIRWFFQLALLGVLILSGIAFYYFVISGRFNLDQVATLPSGIVIYDRHGDSMDAAGASRVLATRKDIPDFLVNALRAREDARFYEHSGIDVRGLMRATIRNIKDLSYTQGASTLSMQLARNSFEIRQKSIHRKLLEMALTLRIESRYSKDEILTHYLNRIYFGSGAYGISQAANTYFGKRTKDLSESESALLVGIIRGPHVFSPYRNMELAIEQRNQTLQRMRAMDLIDDPQLEKLLTAPVKLAEDDEPSDVQTSYALRAVRQELDRILDDDTARIDGLCVISTLDAAWQTRLEHELTHAVEALEAEKSWAHPRYTDYAGESSPKYVQYAAVTTEIKTGGILALIGGRNYRHSRYDRTCSSRDLGSAFEPFVAAAAAERDKLVLPGKPIQTGRQIGAVEVQRIARRLGLDGPFADTEDLFRGSASATPREMAVGLATLSNDGERPKPFLIREIRDRKGTILYSAKPQLKPAMGRNASRDALRVLERKNGTRVFTGATASERDAWTMRLGPNGSTAIWIGFDQPTAIAKEARLKSLLDEFVERLGNE
jgi:penicillin-binding protein 1A